MATTAKQTRPGGRAEKNRQAVAAAVLQLIGEGRLDFEIQEVAAIAGVHRTTLFRRWPDRGDLIAEAMAEHVSRLSIPLTGEWKEDLRRIAMGMRDFLTDPIELAMNRMLVLTDNEIFHKQMYRHWEPIFDTFRAPICEAQAKGQLSEKTDPLAAIWLLISAIVVATVFARSSTTHLTDEFIDRLVQQAIRGLA